MSDGPLNLGPMDFALLLARTMGCTCEPTIEVNEVSDGLSAVNISHDDDCRLLFKAKSGAN